jgi:hypothetical protein
MKDICVLVKKSIHSGKSDFSHVLYSTDTRIQLQVQGLTNKYVYFLSLDSTRQHNTVLLTHV